MISTLTNPDVIQFIQENLAEDPVNIALQVNKYPHLPIREIASQIASRQKVSKKLPEWVQNERLIFPPKENLEQASSQETAAFKASLYKGNSFLDLTGGTGIDTYYLSKNFKNCLYVESDEKLCELARHNFQELGSKIEVLQSSAEDFMHQTKERFDLIYIDPSRRNASGKRLIQIEDYQPNIIYLVPVLLKITNRVLIKVSPMVDLKQVIKQVGGVSRVMCLAVRNEMKELLFEVSNVAVEEPIVEAIHIQQQRTVTFSGTFKEEQLSKSEIGEPETFIYEPNAAIRKAGFFEKISAHFHLKKLSPQTHIYTSTEKIDSFPGKRFKLMEVFKVDKRMIKKYYPNGLVHVKSKNYPQSANEIKKKFRLKDGGDEFLIFCSVQQLGNVCIRCIAQS